MKKQVIWYLTTPWDRVLWLSEIEQKYILIKKCRFIKDLRKSRKGNVINNCAIFLKWYYVCMKDYEDKRSSKMIILFLRRGKRDCLGWRLKEGVLEEEGILGWRERGDLEGSGILAEEWEILVFLDKSLCPIYLLTEQSQAELLD